MSRALSMIAAAALALAAAPVSAQTLTRIETKPFYGAVVTIEEGVRVFRHKDDHVLEVNGQTYRRASPPDDRLFKLR